ncbi:MAG: FAD-dependent oxidoreductase, partial [Acidobacteriota bacterium]
MDVLILGGGIIGLACARELARAGLKVELLERRSAGAEASLAAA